MKKIVIVLCLFLCLVGCSDKKEKKTYEENPIVTMEVEDYGTIVMELYPNIAPNTVANFVNLIEDGFYDGLTFHRAVPSFVIQGGDPDGDSSGGPGYTIDGEFSLNGFANDLSHDRGIVSMARAQDYDSAGSQFFIVLDDSAKRSLDTMYAAFGEVIEGMDVVDEIAKAEVANSDTGMLKENITISKVTVDTKGETYKVDKN